MWRASAPARTRRRRRPRRLRGRRTRASSVTCLPVARRVVVVRELAHRRMRERELMVVLLGRDQLRRPAALLGLHLVPRAVEREPLLVDDRRAHLQAQVLRVIPSAALLARSLE